jgi:hypothetical protein
VKENLSEVSYLEYGPGELSEDEFNHFEETFSPTKAMYLENNFLIHETGADPEDDCSICMNDYKDNEECVILGKCTHKFHVECID